MQQPQEQVPVPVPPSSLETRSLTDGPGETQDYVPRPDAATDNPDAGDLARIGRFEIRRELGEGAFGKVYQAHDPQLDRDVALKVAKLDRGDASQRVQRFLREAKAAAGLRHPNIVPVYEFGQAGAHFFIAAAFISGQTLERSLEGQQEGKPRFSPRQAAVLVRKLAEAFFYAHGQGIVHRDIKPGNVMLEERGEPLALDFGLATRADEAEKLTHAGAVMGTPLYMSPEQATGRSAEATAASDQYSLGVMLFELLTGRPPFRGKAELVMHQHVEAVPPGPRRFVPGLPRDLETICLKCLEKEPARRYGSCQELADDLRRWLDSEPVLARPIGLAERGYRWSRRNPLAAGLLGAVAASLILGATVAGVLMLEANRSAREAARNEKDARDAQHATSEALGEVKIQKKRAEDREKDANRRKLEAEERKQQAEREREAKVEQLERARRNLFTAQLLRVSALMDRDPAAGVELLEDCNACPLDLRDFSWGWYLRLCQRQKRLMRKDPPGSAIAVYGLAASNDGHSIASARSDGSVMLWDLNSGEGKLIFKGSERTPGPVSALAFSPNGKLLAFNAKGITLWDMAAGQEKATLEGHSKRTLCLAFTPDSQTLISGGEDNAIKLWDLAGAREKTTLRGHTEPVGAIAVSLDGKWLASGSRDRTIKLWDLPGGQDKATLRGHTGEVRALALSADGKTLASGGIVLPTHPAEMKLWDTASAQERFALPGTPGHSTFAVAFSPDGFTLASASDTIRLWDTRSGQEKAAFNVRHGSVYSMAFLDHGKRLASAGHDGGVRIWDVTPPSEVTLTGHAQMTVSLALSRDGALLASGGMDRTIKLWDMPGGKEKAILRGHTNGVTGVALSPDGRTLASGSFDRTIKLWDLDTGQPRATLAGHTDSIRSVAMSPDGHTLASASFDRTIRLWDVARGQHKTTLNGHVNIVNSVAFSPNGKMLASGSGDTHVRLWDIPSGEKLARLRGHAESISAVAFSPDGKLLASASRDKTIKLWDLAARQEKVTLQGHADEVRSLSFSADGHLLASGSADRTIRLWDVASGQLKATMAGHSHGVNAVILAGDGKRLFSAEGEFTRSSHGPIKLWEAADPPVKAVLRGHTRTIQCLTASRDGKTLVSGGAEGTICLWDMVTGERRSMLKGQNNEVFCIAISPDGKTLVSAGPRVDEQGKPLPGDVKRWDLASGEPKTPLLGHSEDVRAVAISPDGKTLASGSYDRTIKLWDMASGEEITTMRGHRLPVQCLSFSPDGKTLASGGSEHTFGTFGEVKLWDIALRKERTSLPGHPKGVLAVAFSPDGNRLASASKDNTVKIWDVDSGQEKSTFEGHSQLVHSVAFSPDGKTLATGSFDHTARLWDVATGRSQTTFSLFGSGSVWAVTFSTDGKRLAVGSWDGTIRLWPLP